MPVSTGTLVIENFAGIKRLRLDVRPFTVIIGPQSVGKSITAKLLYYFRMLPQALANFADHDDRSIEEKLTSHFESSSRSLSVAEAAGAWYTPLET